MLLPRAKSSHYLEILLSALLAFPSNLPTLEREDVRADRDSFAGALPGRGSGPRLHRPDRKLCHHLAIWSVDVDEPETPGGRDDLRFAPLALPHRPLDLPSLVPASVDLQPIRPVEPAAPSTYIPPLRC